VAICFSALPQKLVHFVWEEMMISRTWSRKSIAFCVAVAVLSVYSMVTLAAAPQKASGELSVSGQVTVNGQAAISGATIFSDSVITTAGNSNATVSLAKLGRVELYPNSSIKLSFSDGNISDISTRVACRCRPWPATQQSSPRRMELLLLIPARPLPSWLISSAATWWLHHKAGQVELRSGGVPKLWPPALLNRPEHRSLVRVARDLPSRIHSVT
jgi:hypothetical protein